MWITQARTHIDTLKFIHTHTHIHMSPTQKPTLNHKWLFCRRIMLNGNASWRIWKLYLGNERIRRNWEIVREREGEKRKGGQTNISHFSLTTFKVKIHTHTNIVSICYSVCGYMTPSVISLKLPEHVFVFFSVVVGFCKLFSNHLERWIAVFSSTSDHQHLDISITIVEMPT